MELRDNNLALVLLFERSEVESGNSLFARPALALKRSKRHWFGKQLHGKSENLNNLKLCRIKRLFKPALGTVT